MLRNITNLNDVMFCNGLSVWNSLTPVYSIGSMWNCNVSHSKFNFLRVLESCWKFLSSPNQFHTLDSSPYVLQRDWIRIIVVPAVDQLHCTKYNLSIFLVTSQ